MVKCPNCGYEIDSAYHECESSDGCHTTEIWWCDMCGAIAYSWDGDMPCYEDWNLPSR